MLYNETFLFVSLRTEKKEKHFKHLSTIPNSKLNTKQKTLLKILNVYLQQHTLQSF